MWDVIITVSLLTKSSYYPFSSFLLSLLDETQLLLRPKKEKQRALACCMVSVPQSGHETEGAISNGLLFQRIEDGGDCDPGS